MKTGIRLTLDLLPEKFQIHEIDEKAAKDRAQT
jgi:hypothetical protein